jgi:MFS family permease
MFVPANRGSAQEHALRPAPAAISMAAATGLLREPGFRNLMVAGTLLGLTTISDAFLYLGIQQRMQLNVGFFPLLFVFTAAAFMLFAIPVGRLADRFGRAKVFLGGYLILLFVYTILLREEIGWVTLVVYLALHGLYYAATDGVLMALAGPRLPIQLRGSGMALLGTTIGLARLVSSVAFGLVWTAFGLLPTVASFLVALALSLMVAAFLLVSQDSHGVAG